VPTNMPVQPMDPATAVQIAAQAANQMSGWNDRALMIFMMVFTLVTVIGAGFWLIRYFISVIKEAQQKADDAAKQQRDDHKAAMNDLVKQVTDIVEKYHSQALDNAVVVKANTVATERTNVLLEELSRKTDRLPKVN